MLTNFTYFRMPTYENRQSNIFNTKTKKHKSMPLPPTPRKEYKQISSRFQKIKFLGKGKYSDVYMGVDRITNCIFAIKIIKKSIINQFNLSNLLTQEIKILSQMNHSNIMKFYGVISDDKEVAIILECCESSLYKLYDKLDQIKEEYKLQIIFEILQAFSYLHDKGILHRDVKPENIMMIQNHIKVGDFGLAIKLKTKEKMKSICGTPQYMAPEVYKGLDYDIKADCYSLGVIIEELKCKSSEIRNMVHILKQNDCNLRGNVKDFLQLKIFSKVKQILSQTTFK